MYALSNAWFGARLRLATEQVAAAASLGFEAVAFARAEPAPSYDGIGEALRATGIRVVLVEAGALSSEESRRESIARLADPAPAARERALEEILRHVPLGRAAGCASLSIAVGRVAQAGLRERAERLDSLVASGVEGSALVDAAAEVRREAAAGRAASLDRLCRSLHALARREPEASFCVETPAGPDAILDPDATGHLLDDLRGARVGYLHDTANARLLEVCGVAPSGVWLERFVDRLAAVRLGDRAAGEGGRPPGSGEVDFRLVAGYLRRETPRILAVDPRFDRHAVGEGLRYLRKLGL